MCVYLEMGGEENQTFLGIKRLSAKKCIISRKEGFSGIIKTKSFCPAPLKSSLARTVAADSVTSSFPCIASLIINGAK